MTLDNVTTGVAVGAATSPWWLDYLTTVSQLAGLLLPILGVAWLVVQITGYLRRRSKD